MVSFFSPARGAEHPSIGPFDFVQMTYGGLRDDNNNTIAVLNEYEEWIFDNSSWSDFTVSSVRSND